MMADYGDSYQQTSRREFGFTQRTAATLIDSNRMPANDQSMEQLITVKTGRL
jgi:hypothetical protein